MIALTKFSRFEHLHDHELGYADQAIHFLIVGLSMRKVDTKRLNFIDLILVLATALVIPIGAYAQAPTTNEIRIEKLPCGPTAPPVAAVTDLTTGKGIRLYGLDANLDKVPPCGGEQGPIANVGAYPLPNPIPQLVKIRSSGGDCSGSLIALASTQSVATRGVITAAHCVMSGTEYFKNFKIWPGYQNGMNSDFGERIGTEVLTFNGFTASKQNAHDIAVIRQCHRAHLM